jgi:hypothetical protein
MRSVLSVFTTLPCEPRDGTVGFNHCYLYLIRSGVAPWTLERVIIVLEGCLALNNSSISWEF